MFQKILVCLDGSKDSEQILPYAIEQASQFGSKVILLKVNSLAPLAIGFGNPAQSVTLTSATADAVVNNELTEANAYLIKIAETLAEKGLEVDIKTIVGPVADEILQFVTNNCIDLVAMTTRTYNGWKRFFLGSTLDRIIRKCGVPVLVLNPCVDA